MPRSKRLQEFVRLSLMAASVAATTAAVAAEDSGALPEVVVTAQKRAESVQASISAVSAIAAGVGATRWVRKPARRAPATPAAMRSK